MAKARRLRPFNFVRLSIPTSYDLILSS